jgi:hypothetical protein
MKRLVLALLIFAPVLLSAQAAQTPSPATSAQTSTAKPKNIGTISDLMIHMIYPTSDAILYVASRAPENDQQWNELTAKALTLAEAANLLMLPGRARDQGRWMDDAKLMLDAAEAAFKAAQKKDQMALEDLNDAVYTSCTTCHMHYRPNYGRGRATAPAPQK